MDIKATVNVAEFTGRDGAVDHVAKYQEAGAPRAAGRLLHSDSGDRGDWYLTRDAQGVCIIHIPDLSAGKSPRRMDVADVLLCGGPERDELLRLIGTLVDQ